MGLSKRESKARVDFCKGEVNDEKIMGFHSLCFYLER